MLRLAGKRARKRNEGQKESNVLLLTICLVLSTITLRSIVTQEDSKGR